MFHGESSDMSFGLISDKVDTEIKEKLFACLKRFFRLKKERFERAYFSSPDFCFEKFDNLQQYKHKWRRDY
jgi:hypothetical protein